jgi:SpoU rRNA methylase family enzyme
MPSVVAGKTLRYRLLKALFLLMPFLMLTPVGSSAQSGPASFREFLAQYTGKEILLIDKIAENIEFFDKDSTTKYIFVLDEVVDDMIVIHRSTASDKRSMVFPIEDIRRITFLFGGRPYQRIVIETY